MARTNSANPALTNYEWLSRILFIFNTAKSCCMTQEQVQNLTAKHTHEELSREAQGRRLYSMFDQGYVRGLLAASRAEMFQRDLEFCALAEGQLYTWNRDNTSRPHVETLMDAGRGALIQKESLGFYWRQEDKIYVRTPNPQYVEPIREGI